MKISWEALPPIPPPRLWIIQLTDEEVQGFMDRYTIVNASVRHVSNDVTDHQLRIILQELIGRGAAIGDRR